MKKIKFIIAITILFNMLFSYSVLAQTNTDIKITNISSGSNYSLALKNDGTVWAWGNNRNHVLGLTTSDDRKIPEKVIGLSDIVDVYAGYTFSMALKNDGTVWGWGNNLYGQISDNNDITYGGNVYFAVKIYDLSDVIALASSEYEGFALKKDGTVWAWGGISQWKPHKIDGLNDISAISCSSSHLLALKKDGTIKILKNSFSIPESVNGLDNVISVSCAINSSYALKSDGTLWAWGSNAYGQLGDGTLEDKVNPIQIKGLKNIKSIPTHVFNHCLATDINGDIWAWGYNENGQIGNNTTNNQLKPIQVKNISNMSFVSCGVEQSFAMNEKGVIWGWGFTLYGELAYLGNDSSIRVPTQVIPQNIVELQAKSENGLLIINWSMPVSSEEVLEYELFKSTNEPINYVLTINDYRVGTFKYNKYIDLNVKNGTTYYYKVRPILKNGLYGQESKLLNISPSNTAQNNIVLTLNNKKMYCNGLEGDVDPGKTTTPVIVNNRTLLPIRSIVEKMGGTITWSSSEKMVTINYSNKYLKMWIGKKIISVNDKNIPIDVEPIIINGRTMLPLRAIAENLGCSVEWFGDSKQIIIKY